MFPTAQQLMRMVDAAGGSFSFVTDRGIRLTYDLRPPERRIILAREWAAGDPTVADLQAATARLAARKEAEIRSRAI